ncbi:putative beta-lactamase domain-containing protein [Monocercomonoides exilis]|uniref:putative beta-lactamase domain-containing protein n=1 Tax=Monocercomonoides exilis TaxID=2049356 RepID=UPI00355A911D|nr:putative beta-lactamase domain-containing protein [Monocercomonoides exilis]|eukprot:MONOS_7467.1-p1 / transcript=MONOS_7467.1 / gene=MONOS_7467 / organism=Monocercomonoides_exilis_PA203 / gene_product=beta-lactamase domain-containing protein / transcript_product=beta-lactamase domain-containing protein / location=Mono_scaffold00256:3499-4747(+) / protein_length=347 / sequence_SO=supercontig / SO=protein_coding / is_pseudo=false
MSLVDESAYHRLYLIDTQLFGPEAVGSYILISKQTGKAAIIEDSVSCGLKYIMDGLKTAELKPEDVQYLMVTHIHLDHAGCSGSLMKLLPNATFVCHQRGARHMADPTALVAGAKAVYGEEFFNKNYGIVEPVPNEKIHSITATPETFTLGEGCELRVEQTMGHAPHHVFITLWTPSNEEDSKSEKLCRGLFCGDNFFAEYPFFRDGGRKSKHILLYTSPPQFDPDSWHKAADRVGVLHPQLIYLTHFGVVDYEDWMPGEVHKKLDELVALLPPDGDDATSSATPSSPSVVYNADYFEQKLVPIITTPETRTQPVLQSDIKVLAKGIESLYLYRQKMKAKAAEEKK